MSASEAARTQSQCNSADFALGRLVGLLPRFAGCTLPLNLPRVDVDSPAAPTADPATLTTRLKAEARRLGFDLVGACPAVTPAGVHQLYQWLEAGYAGEMHYIANRAEAYRHPAHVLPEARSLLVVGAAYRTLEPVEPRPGQGRVSRYAWGDDYHDILRDKLHALCDFLRAEVPGASARGVVDTAPLLEREFAQLAGLGWVGKNTLILNKRLGSWLFLAAVLTDQPLEYDSPHEASHCGTCTACLDACPTDAFVAPYVLDSRRCISYLTIELRDQVPRDLRPGLGNWIFGCDVCQDVCPWNRKAPRQETAAFMPGEGMNPIDLVGLFSLDDETFRARFRHTPLWRPRRRGILRNAALVLGNTRPPGGIAALALGLRDDEPLVRGAAAWALGQYATEPARRLLRNRLDCEDNAQVREELEAALFLPGPGRHDNRDDEAAASDD